MSISLFRKRTPVSTIVPANGDLNRLRDEMDRTFDRFFSEPLGLLAVEPKAIRSGGWIPPLDVSETEAEITIRAEVPGIAAKDLDISVAGSTLSIAGKKDEQEEQRGEDYYQCERRFGSFRRVLDLPESADVGKVTAESDNGVVTIKVAKKPGAKPRQVEVKAAAPSGRKVPVTG